MTSAAHWCVRRDKYFLAAICLTLPWVVVMLYVVWMAAERIAATDSTLKTMAIVLGAIYTWCLGLEAVIREYIRQREGE